MSWDENKQQGIEKAVVLEFVACLFFSNGKRNETLQQQLKSEFKTLRITRLGIHISKTDKKIWFLSGNIQCFELWF